MDPALAPVYEKLRPKMTEPEFERAIAERRAEFGDLIDDATLALLILDEEGLNEGAVVKVQDLPGRVEATVNVRVGKVFPVRTFEKASGSGRVGNVLVGDETGECRLTLWGRDADKVEDGTLRVGARVKVINARVKETQWGLELHVGPWSVLEVEGALDKAKMKLLTDTRPDADPTAPVSAPAPEAEEPAAPTPAPPKVAQATTLSDFANEPVAPSPPKPKGREHVPIARVREGDAFVTIRGRLVSTAPTRTFRRQDGSTGFVANAEVEDETGRVTLTLWDDAVKSLQTLKKGDVVTATVLNAKARGGRLELHTTRSSQLTRE